MTLSKTDEQIEQCFQGVGRSRTFHNIVDTFSLSDKRVLDIGCAYGEFLTHFGPGSEGITIVDEETQYALKRGLTVHTGNIEDPNFQVDLAAGKFDVVFANNLFEHLYSPHNFLQRVKKVLKDDGLLILGVPCVPKIVSLMHVRKFRGALASNHINFFTRTTLAKTTERAGWKVRECRSFHFKSPLVDAAMHPIAPHFYCIATPDESFVYPEKRQKELKGYTNTEYETK